MAKFKFVAAGVPTDAAARMESHEWRERTDEGVRYWRANLHAGRWSFATTLKSDPDWERLDPVPREVWQRLREILWRKYQRKRCPWKLVENIDKLLEDDAESFPANSDYSK